MADQQSHISLCPAKDREEPTREGGWLFRAAAKLNLTLRVLGRRQDGYHEIDSIAAKITLYDELLFESRADGQVRLACSGHDCGPMEENLVLRAARLLQPAAGGRGADIHLTKQIPPGTGLGGGSSDASATLEGLNRLWQLKMSSGRLSELAGQLGSDVPLFLNGPAVRIRGRGERVDPVKVHPFVAVLCLPDISCNTAEVYGAYDAMLEGKHPPAAGAAADLSGQLDRPPSRWRGMLFNDLQSAAARVCPGLADLSARIASATGLPVHLTGSGSALFVLTDDPAAARRALEDVPADVRPRCRLVCSNPW